MYVVNWNGCGGVFQGTMPDVPGKVEENRY
jgi:hypothetical protein